MKICLKRKGAVYASTACGGRIMNSLFNFYFVKIVLDRYHLSQSRFQTCQIIYAIWNAVNDPWFGYLQDTTTTGWMSVRRKCILYGAIPWAISFLIPWFPWANYSDETNGIICFFQALAALCLFDTFFTFCMLAHCALLTEYGETDNERLDLVKYVGIAGIIGSSSVFFAEYLSGGLKEYGIFQMVCVIQCVISVILFCITGFFAHTRYDGQPREELFSGSYLSLTKEIFWNRNFLLFVTVNFLQEFHISYLLNFSKIFTEQTISNTAVSESSRSFLLGALVVFPQVAVVLVSPLVAHFSLTKTIMMTFYLKILFGVIMYVSGALHTVWFMIFLIIDYTLSDGAFAFFGVILSDIADEDMKLYGRKKPISSLIFGSNALVVKPAISLAPMVVAAILNSFGYESVKSGTASSDDITTFQTTIFTLACGMPVFIGVLQILVWRKYGSSL